MITQNYDIRIFEDIGAIKHVVDQYISACPAKKSGSLLIPFDNEGNLLRDGIANNSHYNYQTRQWVSNTATKVERPNTIFIDAIEFLEVKRYGPRKGKILFKHLDGRKTYMSSKHFEDIVSKLTKGWLIGKFTYVKYYGAYGLDCLEVLI